MPSQNIDSQSLGFQINTQNFDWKGYNFGSE